MDPAPARTDRSLRRPSVLLAPLVLLLSVAAPLGVLAAQSPSPGEAPSAAPASSTSPSTSPSATPSEAPSPTTSRALTPTGSSSPSAPAMPAAPTSKSAFSLVPGDCLPVEPPENASVTVVVLPCTQLHEAEVFAVFALPGPPGVGFPGETVAMSQAAAGCELRFSDYVGIAYGDSAYDYFFYKPSEQTWSALSDRTVTCILTSPPRGVSAKDSRT